MSNIDTRIALSSAGLILFLVMWAVMDYYKVPITDPLMDWVQKSVAVCWTALCLFIKTDVPRGSS